jgi:RimJ/RimL family protein N-acetyltransferase
MNRERTLAAIARLKHLPFGSTRLAVNHRDEPLSLVLLTSDKGDDRELMALLSDWRRTHEDWFLSVFPVTVDRTARWYRERLIESPDRLLFMIEAGDGFIGHIGLFRFDFADGTCEIDNIVRGSDRLPGAMEPAIREMMAWGRRELGVAGYRLQTFSNNERARRLYEKLGFRETGRTPLALVVTDEGREWVDAPAGQGPAVRYNVFMSWTENDE